MPKRKAIAVGDRVSFRIGMRRLRGTVIEDRGALGVGGRQLVRVRFGRGADASETELPAEEVVVTAHAPSHRATG